jgi:hypothetical protein
MQLSEGLVHCQQMSASLSTAWSPSLAGSGCTELVTHRMHPSRASHTHVQW